MRILVTGGAGFIGRWVVEKLLTDDHEVYVLDNLSNGSLANLANLQNQPGLKAVEIGDITNQKLLDNLFSIVNFGCCIHLAASIHVHMSVQDPQSAFDNNILGTFHLLENCRKQGTRMVFMSTCHVFDQAVTGLITEAHPTKPTSPYSGSKLAGEKLVLSYYHAYGLPVLILRPFNTYGPCQKSDSEGGVVSIFIEAKLAGLPLTVHGEGTQTRDLVYVEDCARLVTAAAYHGEINGEIINGGTGRDIAIKDLAGIIAGEKGQVQLIPHVGPRSEVAKLLGDYQKAYNLLGWKPLTSLEEGLVRTEDWLKREKGI
ncbi:MAG: dTDP-glucose 4,6-dehydratase [Thermincolia bacterium]